MLKELTAQEVDDLVERIASQVVEKLSTRPALLTYQQLSEQVNLSVSTLQKLAAEKAIPRIKINNRVVFDLDAVVSALERASK